MKIWCAVDELCLQVKCNKIIILNCKRFPCPNPTFHKVKVVSQLLLETFMDVYIIWTP